MLPAFPGERRYQSPEAIARAERVRKGMFLGVLTVAWGAIYLLWAWQNLNHAYPVISFGVLTAEAMCLTLFALVVFGTRQKRFKPPQGLRALPYPLPSADIFVVVSGQSLHVVTTTLRAVAGVRWPGEKTVYVLDDSDNHSVRVQAQSLGFVYLTRSVGEQVERSSVERQHYCRAGSLNHAMSMSSGDLILVLDANHEPVVDILEALSGYMSFPEVAFVQCRQGYLAPESDPFYSRNTFFHRTVQSALDSANAVLSRGSGVLYRREALKSVGGFASWNTGEALTTSYKLHAQGWKSFYLPHSLTTAAAVDTIQGVYRHRGRWSADAFRLLLYDCPLFRHGMSWRVRLTYLTIPLAYLVPGLAVPFLLCAPLWSYVSGQPIFTSDFPTFVLVRGAYFVAMALALRVLYAKQSPAKLIQFTAGLFPIFLWGIIRAIISGIRRKQTFRPGNATPESQLPSWVLLSPQLALFAASALLPYIAFHAGTLPPQQVAINGTISLLALWCLSHVLAAGLLPRRFFSAGKSPADIYS